MKKHPLRRIVLSTAGTVSVVVLLLVLKPQASESVSLQTGGATAAPTAAASGTGAGTGATTGTAAAGSTVAGSVVETPYGPVQAQITVTAGQVTAASAAQAPSSSARSQELTATAIPQLAQAALSAQSAEIDTVSGATYTSEGYRTSLQSALDSAGL